MSSISGTLRSPRKRVSGLLERGPRGLNLVTDIGDLWVLDCDAFDNDLIGRQVVAEGVLTGLDRLQVDWFGELALLWQLLQSRLGDAFVTVRASPGRRSCEEVEDGLPDGGHARLRWWPCDSFFSVPLL